MIKDFHGEILSELEKHSGHGTKHSGNAAYLGNTHFSYHISNPVRRDIAKAFLKTHKDISFKEFAQLLDALFKGKSHDEKSIAAMLLEYSKVHRKNVAPRRLDAWLDHLIGWAEVDSLCQSNFTADEMLSRWNVWKATLVAFSKDKNVHKRRASLVLLTGPVAHSSDPRLSKIAFENIGRLKSEKGILITKAISWLLRSLIRYRKKEVATYLKKNVDGLPKIAIRETRRKLLTGKK